MLPISGRSQDAEQGWKYLSPRGREVTSSKYTVLSCANRVKLVNWLVWEERPLWYGWKLVRKTTTERWTSTKQAPSLHLSKYVCNGTRHRKHTVRLLPPWMMHVDTVVLKSAGIAGSEHTDDSISEIIRNGSHAPEGAQSPYLPFKAKKLLHRQENRGNAGRLYSNAYQWKAPLG